MKTKLILAICLLMTIGGYAENIDSTQWRIDSLRRIVPGVPVVVEEDTLFNIYASIGGEDATHRAAELQRRITQIGKSLKLTTDTMHIFESDFTADIMCGELVIMRVSDLDGLWNGMTRDELAKSHLKVISAEIEKLHNEYGLTAKLQGFGWAVFLIVVQIVFFVLTVRFIRHLRRKVIDGFSGKLHPLVIKGYEILNLHQLKRIFLFLIRVLQVLLVIAQLLVSLPLLFSIFPETEKFTWNMINFVWEPLRDIMVSFVKFFPNLVKIIVILIVVRWLLRGIFVAAIFSLGSTTTIGNLISGIIITYMRPFLVGDFVRIGDSEGTVVEKNAFVTRLRDIKDNLVTVPNNSILSMQTVNYTSAARDYGGSIVHSDFTFTYKVPRSTIESYLLEAAARSTLLLKEPAPFVLVTQLEDFYTRYQINAYTLETNRLFDVYSEMHKNILDVFREHDLDPTSSHFVAVKENKS